jgi:hypothetical protein
MAGVDQVNLGLRQVARIGFGAGRDEESVVAAQTVSSGGRCLRK